jgi:2-dehydro-3-deoxyphosphogluconate aldolase / (4S)-4-hydroxy-2-oxoglutarate aldolase
MMKYTNEQVISRMEDAGVVPLFSHDDISVSKNVLQACYKGGMTVFEYTNRQPNSFEIFCELVEFTQDLPGFMLGIGTVMDGETAIKFIDAGAHFIISPIMVPEMGEVCRKNGIPWIPGCATLTEIALGVRHGAAVVKIFPGSILGPKFVSSIRPVIPHVPLMITGGVEPNAENFKSWFDAGATCVGLGSNLFSKDIMSKNDYPALEKRVRDVLDIVKRLRTGRQ